MITLPDIGNKKSYAFCVDMSNKSLFEGEWTSSYELDFKPDFMHVKQIIYNSGIIDINTYIIKSNFEGIEEYLGGFINSSISYPDKYVDLKHMTENKIKFNVCSPDMNQIDLLNITTPSFQNNSKALTGNLIIFVEFIGQKIYSKPEK